MWCDAICKEMGNVRPAFEVFEGTKDHFPLGYQFMKCHMIFGVEFGETFRRKAWLVAGCHMTETLATLTYSSVVLRDSVRIALTLAALNDLQVMSCDINNAYLTADCREKIWTYAGPEFGSEQGCITFVKKALYGLKSYVHHTGDKVTRRSQTGILIFLNCAHIIWYSKRENTIEMSTFGSEFIAMKMAVEQIESLWYKLSMLGVPLEGPTNVFYDNEAVFNNTSQPDSTLKKKHMSICYHCCIEAIACRTIRICKEGKLTNLSALFTKPLTRFTRENLLDCFTY